MSDDLSAWLEQGIKDARKRGQTQLAAWLEELRDSRLLVEHIATDGAMITDELVLEARRILSKRENHL